MSLEDCIGLDSEALMELSKITLRTYRISTPRNRYCPRAIFLQNQMLICMCSHSYPAAYTNRSSVPPNEEGFRNQRSVIISCPHEAGSVGSPGSVASYKLGN